MTKKEFEISLKITFKIVYFIDENGHFSMQLFGSTKWSRSIDKIQTLSEEHLVNFKEIKSRHL